MTLLYILSATIAGGVLSVLLAATLSLTLLNRFADRMVAFSVGVLLTFALIDLLPEAIELGLSAERVGQVILAGIVAFFVLEKAMLWHHGHNGGGHPPQVAMIVLGDGMHNLVDGILIAAAFLSDTRLGWLTTAAVFAHEVPQEISDFMVLLNAGLGRSKALAMNAVSGGGMVLGGVLGYLALAGAQKAIPYVLVVSAASFLYIAVADLLPELHRQRRIRDTALQLLLMALGVAIILATIHLFGHEH